MERLLVLFVIFTLTSCGKNRATKHENDTKKTMLTLTPAAIKNGDFKTALAGPGEIKQTVQLQGGISPNGDNVTSVVSHVSGVVLKVYHQLGVRVKKGDPLAELNSKEMGQAQLDYIAHYRKMSFAWNRLQIEKGIYDKKIGTKLAYLRSKESFDKGAMARDLAAQKLRLLGVSEIDIKKLPSRPKSKLTVYMLRAPVDGIIIKKSIANGEMAKSDQAIFTIADLSSVWLDIKVPIQYLSAIKVTQEVDVYSGKLKRTTSGKVIYISPTADAKTRSALVRIMLPNESGLWRPGLCAMGEFVVKKMTAPVVIPRTAVVQVAGSQSVFVDKGEGKYMMKTVLVGEQDRFNIAIRGGINSGERVVTSNVIALKGEWLATMGE